MKKLLATAAVAALMTPFAAMAESEDSLSIQMAATVEDVCTVAFDSAAGTVAGNGATGGALNTATVTNAGVGTANPGTAEVQFATLIANSDDPLSATIGDIDTVTITLTAELFCNGDYDASIDFANGVFQNTVPVTNITDFSNQLAYNVTVSFDTDSANPPFDSLAQDSLAGDQLNLPGGSQHRGQISIQIVTGQGDVVDNTGVRDSDHNLIAGLYTEAMTLSFVMDGVIPAVSFDTTAPAPQTAN